MRSPAGQGQPPEDGPLAATDVRDATLAALAAEHAAIWSYGLASAFLPAATQTAVTEASEVHRERRDAVVALLEGAGTAPVPAAASYRLPSPVTGPASAAGLLVVAEEDVAVAWRAVCERTAGPGGSTDAGDTGEPGETVDAGTVELRRLGVGAVVASAVTGLTWRRLAGARPEVPIFPGTP